MRVVAGLRVPRIYQPYLCQANKLYVLFKCPLDVWARRWMERMDDNSVFLSQTRSTEQLE